MKEEKVREKESRLVNEKILESFKKLVYLVWEKSTFFDSSMVEHLAVNQKAVGSNPT